MPMDKIHLRLPENTHFLTAIKRNQEFDSTNSVPLLKAF